MTRALEGAKRWWRDWRRGYSDADVESALAKIRAERRPGAVIEMTDGEMKACAYDHRIHSATWDR